MKRSKIFMLALLCLSLSTLFIACQKEEIPKEVAPETEEVTDLKLDKEFLKEIEILSEDRKSKAVIIIQADDEKALSEFSTENFVLKPLYEVAAEENTVSEENTESLEAPELKVLPFTYEVKIVEEDPDAIGYSVDFNLDNASRAWVYWGYIRTSYDCARINTHYGRNLVHYYDQYCSWFSCGGYGHSFTASHYAGGWSSSCRNSNSKLVYIYWSNAYNGWSFTYHLYN